MGAKDPQRAWRILCLVAGAVSIVAIHGPLIGYKTFANVDEAYAGALAERLLEGFKLYQGAVSQRGPLMYYAFEGIAALHGWDNIVALRLWALALSLAHFFSVYWAGRTLLSDTAATVAALASAYALAFGFPPSDALAINGESLQLPVLVVGVVLGARAMQCAPQTPGRMWRLVVSGILFGTAISIKQSVVLHPLALLVWLAIDAHRRKAKLAATLADAAILGVCCALVPAILTAHAAAEGTLKDLYYYCVTYNREVHLRPTARPWQWLPFFFFRLAENTLFFTVGVFLFARSLPYLIRRVRAALRLRDGWALTRGFGPRVYIGLHLALALLAASSMYRFFPHYYLQAAPFMALAVGAALDGPFRRRLTAFSSRMVVSAFAVFIMFCAALGCIFGEKVDGRLAHDRTVIDMGKLIEATTRPDDRIFVWGFSSWLYQYAHRRPAGRYVFETYVTGFVPWFWEKLSIEKARIVPGSVEALLGDLDRETPEIVVDAGSIMMARPMRAYDAPAAWLHAHYCFEVRIGALDMYRRKADGSVCAQPWFPRVHETIDWNGRLIPIPVARTVDFDVSPPLPQGNYLKPLWFAGSPPIGLAAIRDAKRDKEEAEAEADGFYVPRADGVGSTGDAGAPAR